MDSHLSGKALGEYFEGVRVLSTAGREAAALSLPVSAGTKVSFAGTLGSYLTYEDAPKEGQTGKVVPVKSATGEVTHHDGKVFVEWDDGKFRAIHATHLRVASKADEKEVKELLEAKPDNEFLQSVKEQLDDDRSLSDKQEAVLDEIRAEVKETKKARSGVGGVLRSTLLPDDILDGTKLFLSFDEDTGQYLVHTRFQVFFRSGKGYEPSSPGARRALAKAEAVFDSIESGERISPVARKVASLGDLTEFMKVAEGKLIHKSTNDLWSYSKDADGNFLVSRLFDDEGEPLMG